MNNKQILQFIQIDQNQSNDEFYLLIHFITKKLDEEVKQAKNNLFYASKNGPMYGCLTGINALLGIFNGEKYCKDKINSNQIEFIEI